MAKFVHKFMTYFATSLSQSSICVSSWPGRLLNISEVSSKNTYFSSSPCVAFLNQDGVGKSVLGNMTSNLYIYVLFDSFFNFEWCERVRSMGAVSIISERIWTALDLSFSILFCSLQSMYSCATTSFTASGIGSTVFRTKDQASGIKSLKEVRLGAKFSGSATPARKIECILKPLLQKGAFIRKDGHLYAVARTSKRTILLASVSSTL